MTLTNSAAWRLTLLVMILIATPSASPSQWPGLTLQVRASGSYLGLGLADLDEDRAKVLQLSDSNGVEVQAVLEGGAAYQAGIRPGDVLLSYNGEKLLGSQQLIRLVSETPPGRRVLIVFWRAGKQKQVTVTTGTRPPLSEQVESVASVRVTDIPSPIMLWRNMLLGVESESLSDQLQQFFGVKQGILIWTVSSGSPAQHAGLRAGDVVVGICGRAIHSPREVGFALQQMQDERKHSSLPISIDVMRDHKALSLSIALDSDSVR